jgi:glycosyltransferase involved in cell wall biosynthesis
VKAAAGDQAAARRPLFLARGGQIDGQQRQVHYLGANLAELGRAPLVVLDSEGPFVEALRGAGVETQVHRMAPWRAPLRFVSRWADALGLARAASGRGVGIVHAHDVWRAEYARFVAKRLGVPYVVHVRGPVSRRDIAKHRLALADAVVAIARRYVDDLLEAGVDSERIRLIDDSVDISRFDPAAVAETERKRGDACVVGFVGRISPFKAVLEFLDILSRLPAPARERVRVVVAGEWEEPEYARRVAARLGELALTRQVCLVGRLPAEKMPEFLAGIDLLATLSGGSVMFEAMAMAKPVLSIRADGRHSQHTRHDRTAWCVDTIDPQVCAAELARLVADAPLRARLGAAARERAVGALSSAAMAQKTVALYDDLMSARGTT